MKFNGSHMNNSIRKIKSCQNNKGFTLMELMIVIAIIGVIVLVAYPNFKGSKQDSALYGEARKVMTDIRYTQQLASNVRQQCSLNFSSTGYSIQYNGTTDKSVTFENSVAYISGGSITVNISGIITGYDPVLGQIITFRKGTNSNVYLKIDNAGRVSIAWQ